MLMYFRSVDFQRGTGVPADLEKGRGRLRLADDGGDARLLAELVADSLHADDGDTAGGRTTRTCRLYNRCSMKYVRVAGKRVDSAASHDDIYSV